MGERALWYSVIIRAALDAYGVNTKGNEQSEARLWFEGWSRDAREDFETVCALAGVDAGSLRAAYHDGSLRALLMVHQTQGAA